MHHNVIKQLLMNAKRVMCISIYENEHCERELRRIHNRNIIHGNSYTKRTVNVLIHRRNNIIRQRSEVIGYRPGIRPCIGLVGRMSLKLQPEWVELIRKLEQLRVCSVDPYHPVFQSLKKRISPKSQDRPARFKNET